MKCCDIHAGKLRHKISLQRREKTPDGGGGYTYDWVEYDTTYAWIRPMSGVENLVAMRIESNITHDLFIRYRADLNAKDRIVFGSRSFDVVSVINIEERNKWLQLRCEEGTNVSA